MDKEFINAYAKAAKGFPLLTAEQEAELAAKGTPRARQRLVECNLRLALKQAHKYVGFNRSRLAELIQQANLGLCEAAQSFDPAKGRFTTHATYSIRARILGWILTTSRIVRAGTTTENGRKMFWQLPGIRGALEAKGIEATPEAIASELGLDPKGVRDLLVTMDGCDVSTSAPVGDTDSSGSFGDTLVSDTPDPETVADGRSYRREISRRIAAVRAKLTDKQAVVLDRIILAQEPMSLAELSREWGCSREYVRQLDAAIKRKLQLQLDDLYEEIQAP